jgi:protein-S-isoprenylcysteine O-methyltransferase Ste14
LAILAETYLFPLLFSYYVYENWLALSEGYDFLVEIILRLRAGAAMTIQYLNFLSETLYRLLLIFFNLLIIWALLIRKDLRRRPEGWLEYLLPCAGTFSYLCYNILPYLPKGWNFMLAPPHTTSYLSLVGSVIGLCGLTVSCLGTYDLRRSFGIFVQVRRIITVGTFKYVRHPIYLGYLFVFVGFLLIVPRLYNLLITLLSIGLTVLRAMIEERKLAMASPEYRSYMRKTPMFCPLRWNGPSDSPSV